jgi:hypothetical protein
MKSLLSIVLIAGFMGIAVFGALDANHEMAHTGGCIAATAKRMDCPKENPIDLATFHLDAYKGFSLATFGESVAGALLLVFASLLFIGLVSFLPYPFKPPEFAFHKYRLKYAFSPPQEQKLVSWLALRENSPTSP